MVVILQARGLASWPVSVHLCYISGGQEEYDIPLLKWWTGLTLQTQSSSLISSGDVGSLTHKRQAAIKAQSRSPADSNMSSHAGRRCWLVGMEEGGLSLLLSWELFGGMNYEGMETNVKISNTLLWACKCIEKLWRFIKQQDHFVQAKIFFSLQSIVSVFKEKLYLFFSAIASNIKHLETIICWAAKQLKYLWHGAVFLSDVYLFYFPKVK